MVKNVCRFKFQGFSILEILLATTFGMILLGGVLQVYLGIKSSFRAQENLARAQENLRFAKYTLTQNISMAGYSGCRKINELFLSNHTIINFSLENSLHGYSSNNVPYYLLNNVVPNNDVLVIQKADADATRVIANVVAGSSNVKVKQNPATITNQILFISDCKNADLFTATNWLDNDIKTKDKFANSYAIGVSEVGRFEETAYFISDTKRVDDSGKPIYGLYQMVNQGNKAELIDAIQSMQISYNVMGKYLSSSEVDQQKAWQKITAVVITLNPGRWRFYIKLRER